MNITRKAVPLTLAVSLLTGCAGLQHDVLPTCCWVHDAQAEEVAAVEEVMVKESLMPESVRVELDVKFDFDNAKVKEGSYGDIESLANFMKQYPQTTTVVEGHSDSIGTDGYNQILSEHRANAVRDVLVNQFGVDGERVDAVGHGESLPVVDNATAADRAINRRVEAVVEAQP